LRQGSTAQSRRQNPCPERLAQTALRCGSVAHAFVVLHDAVHIPPGAFTAQVPFV
jgi:hypothetical protein